MAEYLTSKQLAKKNDGYNSDRAGEWMGNFCASVRDTLIGQLVKPNINDITAFEAYIEAKVAIKNMDYNELLSASRSV